MLLETWVQTQTLSNSTPNAESKRLAGYPSQSISPVTLTNVPTQLPEHAYVFTVVSVAAELPVPLPHILIVFSDKAGPGAWKALTEPQCSSRAGMGGKKRKEKLQ